MTIIRVRRTLSEIETETNGMLKLKAIPPAVLPHLQAREMAIMKPDAALTTLARGIVNSLWRTRIRTHGGKEHERGESDDPEFIGVDYVAAIQLGGTM